VVVGEIKVVSGVDWSTKWDAALGRYNEDQTNRVKDGHTERLASGSDLLSNTEDEAMGCHH